MGSGYVPGQIRVREQLSPILYREGDQADWIGCLREGAFAKRNFIVFRYVEKGDETDGQRPETMPW